MGLNIESNCKIVKTETPNSRQGGVILGSVDELVEKLKNDVKIL